VQWYESAAACDILEQRSFLFRLNPINVGVYDQRGIAREIRLIDIRHLIGVAQVNAALFQHRRKLLKSLGRTMGSVVTQEQNVEVSRNSQGAAETDNVKGDEETQQNPENQTMVHQFLRLM
jgi:hypothetical protein